MRNSLSIYSLSYQENLLSNYQALRYLPGFVLLESSDTTKGRYDIVTALPYDALQLKHNEVKNINVYELLKKRLPNVPSTSSLPFQGGAIGYIGYDLASLSLGLTAEIHPLCADLPVVDLRFYDWAIISDHYTKTVQLVTTHQRSETEQQLQNIIKLWQHPRDTREDFYLTSAYKPLMDKKHYERAFHDIQRDLQQGRAYQVNLTQPFLASYKGSSWDMYKNIRCKNPTPYAAFLELENHAILSFSPERFLHIDNGQIETMPIKGSIRRIDDAKIDIKQQHKLINCAKNHAENIMIVDLLRNDLGKVAIPGSVEVPYLCKLQSFSGVHHLVSHIKAKYLPHLSPIDIFASCFPGGSITGAPKKEVMQIISEHELYARSVYCGSIGYFSNHGKVDTNIAIRTVIAKNNDLYLQAGGGIVIDSDCEQEYQECYTKITAIIQHS